MKKKETLAMGLASLAGVATLIGVGLNAKAAFESFIPGVLLFDVAVIAVAGVILVSVRETSTNKWLDRTPLMVSGALLGATAIAPVLVAPWIVAGAVGFGVSAAMGGRAVKRRFILRSLLFLSAAGLNFFALWFVIMSGIKAAPAEDFLSTPFRVHSFLTDVQLHDVWVIELRGGGEGKTIRDVRDVLSTQDSRFENAVVLGMIALRHVLGQVFGWDNETHHQQEDSYENRLTETDKSLSSNSPSESGGAFRMIYSFERELLWEIMNETVHAFMVMAMEPNEDGYTLYLAVYVKPIGPVTSRYMNLIDPFRRLFIYPAMVKRLESGWARKFESQNR